MRDMGDAGIRDTLERAAAREGLPGLRVQG
jgi:hypothetical protein